MAYFGAPLYIGRLASKWEKSCVFNLLGQIKVFSQPPGLQETLKLWRSQAPQTWRNVGELSERQQFLKC